MLIRYGEPSKYDHACYGTVCKSIKMMDDKFEIYVQLSENDEFPVWEKVGIFSENTHHKIQEEVDHLLYGRKIG